MRPVRLPPCAAGAKPTTSSRALGSPKPGTGLPQYSSSRNAARFSHAVCSRHATRRGHFRHAMIVSFRVVNDTRAAMAGMSNRYVACLDAALEAPKAQEPKEKRQPGEGAEPTQDQQRPTLDAVLMHQGQRVRDQQTPKQTHAGGAH